jgi:hypothetical protein
MKIVCGVVMLLLAANWWTFAAAPTGWFLAGSRPANYETGVDPNTSFAGLPSAFLKAKADSDGGGTLMQSIAAKNYLGKRVRLSGYVKSQNIAREAGLWMRVDGPGAPPRMLAFDNMQDRAIKGTIDWQRYEVVLDVPDSAVGISFGVRLEGTGEVWLNNAEIEVVSTTVPTTGLTSYAGAPDSPRNLKFTDK